MAHLTSPPNLENASPDLVWTWIHSRSTHKGHEEWSHGTGNYSDALPESVISVGFRCTGTPWTAHQLLVLQSNLHGFLSDENLSDIIFSRRF